MAGPANDIQTAQTSSIVVGEIFFGNLIGGIDREHFMANFWERKPLHISRQRPDIYNSLGISLATVDEMLRSNVIEFTKNLDITSYIDGERRTHNPGIVFSPEFIHSVETCVCFLVLGFCIIFLHFA